MGYSISLFQKNGSLSKGWSEPFTHANEAINFGKHATSNSDYSHAIIYDLNSGKLYAVVREGREYYRVLDSSVENAILASLSGISAIMGNVFNEGCHYNTFRLSESNGKQTLSVTGAVDPLSVCVWDFDKLLQMPNCVTLRPRFSALLSFCEVALHGGHAKSIIVPNVKHLLYHSIVLYSPCGVGGV